MISLTKWATNFSLFQSIKPSYGVLPASCSIGKGKAVPLQAWTGPEGSRRLRLPDFKKISI
jgi:hypothetical protein